ncbi:TetR/AcrR family transcriptional regulator [Pseudonocardia sp. GCM10023141]|uniref:TetR/AcrR family transcriptional regulator n=1 Tax=Pseudonocardia sp. GCM10023141 TaxID=3252653 RepID=UPI00361FF03A
MPTRARERLLDAARQLFYAEGVRAVGVDRLLTVSGVGRASFYRHFASKDDLVAAVLISESEDYLAWLRSVVEAGDGDPLAVFDGLATRFTATDFRGCAALNAMVEIVEVSDPAYALAAGHKRAVIAYLDGVLDAAGHPDHAALAEQFMQLIDGANVTSMRERTTEAAQRAKSMAALLLNTGTGGAITTRLPVSSSHGRW